jgi:hypothetical protein
MFVGGRQTDAADLGERICVALFGLLIGVFFGTAVMFMLGQAVPSGVVETGERYEIGALQDAFAYSGRFFLGSGTVNGEIYFFYYQREGAGYVARQAEGWRTVIYTDESERPYVATLRAAVVDPVWANFAMSWGSQRSYAFHVPPGSIVSSYTLDLR